MSNRMPKNLWKGPKLDVFLGRNWGWLLAKTCPPLGYITNNLELGFVTPIFDGTCWTLFTIPSFQFHLAIQGTSFQGHLAINFGHSETKPRFRLHESTVDKALGSRHTNLGVVTAQFVGYKQYHRVMTTTRKRKVDTQFVFGENKQHITAIQKQLDETDHVGSLSLCRPHHLPFHSALLINPQNWNLLGLGICCSDMFWCKQLILLILQCWCSNITKKTESPI